MKNFSVFVLLSFLVFIFCTKNSATEPENTPGNHAPVIISMTAVPWVLRINIAGQADSAFVGVVAVDLDLDSLTYEFSATVGNLKNINANEVIYFPPAVQGEYVVSCTVSDGETAVADSIVVHVSEQGFLHGIDPEDIAWQKMGSYEWWSQHIMASPNGSIFAIDERAQAWDGPAYLYRSTDNGENWALLNNWHHGIIDHVFNQEGDFFISGYQNEGWERFARSTDNGETWTDLSIDYPRNCILHTLAITPQGVIFAGIRSYYSGPDYFALYKSMDNGDAWSLVGLTPKSPDHLELNSDGEMFLGSSQEIYFSDDYGKNWVKTNFPDSETVRKLFVDPGGNFFARTYHKVYRSMNKAVNWTELEFFNANPIKDIMSSNTGILIAGQDYGLFVSQDLGDTWVKTSFPDIFIRCFTISAVGYIFVFTNEGVFRSDQSF